MERGVWEETRCGGRCVEGWGWEETGCGGRGVGGDRVWREIEAVFV